MASSLKSAGSGKTEAFGATNWSNAGNVVSSNNTYATVTLDAAGESYLIVGYNFGFDIPTDATIDGIVFEVEWKCASGTPSVLVSTAYATKDVTDFWTAYGEQAFSATIPTTEAYQSCGSSSALWATTWTPAEINSPNFGIGVAAKNSITPGNVISVDHIRITVYYTEAAGGGTARRRRTRWFRRAA